MKGSVKMEHFSVPQIPTQSRLSKLWERVIGKKGRFDDLLRMRAYHVCQDCLDHIASSPKFIRKNPYNLLLTKYRIIYRGWVELSKTSDYVYRNPYDLLIELQQGGLRGIVLDIYFSEVRKKINTMLGQPGKNWLEIWGRSI